MKLHSVKIFTDENISPKVVAFRGNSDTKSVLKEGCCLQLKEGCLLVNHFGVIFPAACGVILIYQWNVPIVFLKE
jgi:hypothetical protein